MVSEKSGTRPPRRSERLAAEAGLELVPDEGGGAFYGPKISVQARDAIGRNHQVSTIQLDFQEPQRFGFEYVGADNARHRPIMIHRALFGSVERFLAILIEHYAGNLPTWLMPEQVRVLPVKQDTAAYAQVVVDRLAAAGLRATIEPADTGVPARVARAKIQKIPYVLVVGDEDVAARQRRGQPPGNDPSRTGGPPRTVRGDGRRRGGRARGGPTATARGTVSPLEQLWAGWRTEYVTGSTEAERGGGDTCVFCRIAMSGPPSVDNGIVHRTENCYAVLNAYPYASGHLLVLPMRHVEELGNSDRARGDRALGDDQGRRRRPGPRL